VGKRLGLLLLVASCSACAAVAHKHIKDDKADAASTGIRYYGTSPYLLAHSDGKGGIIVSKILHLPDPAKKMSAESIATLADIGGTLEFDRGVLTTANATGDAAAIPTAILKAVEKVAPALLAAMDVPAKKDDPLQIPGPYLYKIVLRGGEPHLIGGAARTPIKITLLAPEKEN
jgi:hypothetical protein